MSVKILISRTCPHNREAELRQLLRPLRQLVPEQRGYISGEYLISVDHPGKVLTISSWLTQEDWMLWYESEARKRLQAQIDAITDVTTEYEVFEHFSVI